MSRFGRFVLLCCIGFLVACGSSGGGSSSGSDSAPGVDESPRQVLMRWAAIPDVAGYVIHWGTSSGQYDNALDVGDPPSNAAGVVSFELEVGGVGGTIFFALTSYDDQARMSSFSNEVSTFVP